MRGLLRLMALLAGGMLAGWPAAAEAAPVSRLSLLSAPAAVASSASTRALWTVADGDGDGDRVDDRDLDLDLVRFDAAGRQTPRERAAAHPVSPCLIAAPNTTSPRPEFTSPLCQSTDRHTTDGRGPPVSFRLLSSR